MTRVALSKLHPAPWNPRTIKDDRFQNLCRSLEADPEFMVLRPVLATKDGTIYAGNMRYRAAAHLGWTDIEARLADIPDQLAKERALRDNAGWGENADESLGQLLSELKEAGSDINLLGFDSAEIERLLGSVAVDAETPLPPPEVAYQNQYAVAVLCSNEEEQQQVFDALSGKGYRCKVLVV